ncbi:hypothetical protein [Streptomyces sp. MMG1533]|uniref:hypothetical protein n=1 Tax=Streptomyces sp. MMG1533 TaxID=1415546 RepID=UPI00131E0386|nr:hypothetical protein [Streptomyces sp. MMG1533]
MIPDAPGSGLPRALAAAQAFHFQGVRRPARGERAAAKGRAEQDAPAYPAAETARLNEVRQQLAAEAEQWWQALESNDEDTVCEAVNTEDATGARVANAVGNLSNGPRASGVQLVGLTGVSGTRLG